jgi:hypothetical protein
MKKAARAAPPLLLRIILQDGFGSLFPCAHGKDHRSRAGHRITFTTEGAGELLTTDSGDQRETESFARPDKKALAGYTVACIRSLRDVCGSLTVSATAEGLAPGSVTVEVER